MASGANRGAYYAGFLEPLQAAGIDFPDLKAVKTHNPFAVNDVYFARESGLAIDAINRYGSPLVYGHPQGPTGMRVVIELITSHSSSSAIR